MQMKLSFKGLNLKEKKKKVNSLLIVYVLISI